MWKMWISWDANLRKSKSGRLLIFYPKKLFKSRDRQIKSSSNSSNIQKIFSQNTKKNMSEKYILCPFICFVREIWWSGRVGIDVTGCIVLVLFNHKQVILDSLKHCTLTVTTDGSKDLLIVISPVATSMITDQTKLCLWNARSLRDKSACLVDYIYERNVDLFAVTESWLMETDAAVKSECTPDGYKMFSTSRPDRKGRGIALICRSNMTVREADVPRRSSFEMCEWSLSSGHCKMRLKCH